MCYIHLEEDSYKSALIASPSNHTLDTFHRFPYLPIELRLRIWTLSVDARVIEIVYCKFHWKWRCVSESYPPASGLLRANKESRKEYRRKWSPFFGLCRKVSSHEQSWYCYHGVYVGPARERRITYFNPEIDTLYIAETRQVCLKWGSWYSLKELPRLMTSLTKLRSLAVEWDWWAYYAPNHLEYFSFRSGVPAFSLLRAQPSEFFPELKLLNIVIRDSFMDYSKPEGAPAYPERPRGAIEIGDASDMVRDCRDAKKIYQIYEKLDIWLPEHQRDMIPKDSWAIKMISRGGRRGHRYWQFDGLGQADV